MPELDILYMTRIQRERFYSQEEYLRHKDAFILDPDKLAGAKQDLTIMHPLPRVNEIATSVDSGPRAKYFEQALNGKYIRMALILTLLKWVEDEPLTSSGELTVNGIKCTNPHCIANHEALPQISKRTDKNTFRCIYCETRTK